ncbi:hypothetical protein HPT29_017385 [Microvirga terrae]|uniref:DUF3300 domain-containing protein n=1 Tax=Microvirga terrae TaxID=2740529 RepID=A0ABY5RPM5_9HYPH|nr:hypothetical protein [Microvirga terrae]UVF18274.1 hypothetical protein HPT29_017385 [Microvirga terrae]
MFSILRFILIVGAIFYYSPVRQHGEGTADLQALLAPKTSEATPEKSTAENRPGHLETVWKALPDSAKQAVVDKILTTSGFPAAGPTKPTDTLRPEDRAPAASKPRM